MSFIQCFFWRSFERKNILGIFIRYLETVEISTHLSLRVFRNQSWLILQRLVDKLQELLPSRLQNCHSNDGTNLKFYLFWNQFCLTCYFLSCRFLQLSKSLNHFFLLLFVTKYSSLSNTLIPWALHYSSSFPNSPQFTKFVKLHMDKLYNGTIFNQELVIFNSI